MNGRTFTEEFRDWLHHPEDFFRVAVENARVQADHATVETALNEPGPASTIEPAADPGSLSAITVDPVCPRCTGNLQPRRPLRRLRNATHGAPMRRLALTILCALQVDRLAHWFANPSCARCDAERERREWPLARTVRRP